MSRIKKDVYNKTTINENGIRSKCCKKLIDDKWVTDASYEMSYGSGAIKDVMGARTDSNKAYLQGSLPLWMEIVEACKDNIDNLRNRGEYLNMEDQDILENTLARELLELNEETIINVEENKSDFTTVDEENFGEEYEGKINAIQASGDNWGLSQKGRAGLKAMSRSMRGNTLRSGMFTAIPITCKGEKCPYASTCDLIQCEMEPEGELCPVELAEVITALEAYDKEFDFNACGRVDQVHISEIIAADIMCIRAKKNIQKLDCPIEDVIINYGEDGTPIYEKQISKFITLDDLYIKRRDKLYANMLATRKDKKGTDAEEGDLISAILEEIRNDQYIVEEKPDQFKKKDEVIEVDLLDRVDVYNIDEEKE